MENAIEIKGLSKRYKIYKKQVYRIFEMLSREKRHQEYWALQGINLTVKKGEAVGIVGANGAGKSTLLKLICGALHSTAGEIVVNGRILSLLELGTGFHSELTGIENIYNSASMQGFSKREINAKLQEIIEFADIGEHVTAPVKTYSSGMYVRLAFALYACLDPDIYIVDEALSVGDVFFQQKCYERMRQMKEQGVTIIMVSHDPAPIVNFCDRAVLIEKGKIIGEGAPDIILDMYQALQYNKGMKSDYEIKASNHIEFGTDEAKFVKYMLVSESNEEKLVWGVDELCRLQIECESYSICEDVSVGLQIKDSMGNIIFGTNSNWLGESLKFEKGKLCCTFEFPIYIGEGKYTITLAITENKTKPIIIYSWLERAIGFEIINTRQNHSGGIVCLPIKINH